jgi:hypothetical protein
MRLGTPGPDTFAVLNYYTMTGQPTGLESFGATGYMQAGGNPVAQFLGSFRWTVTPTSGGLNLTLTNTTSFRSLTADRGPQWQRLQPSDLPNPYGMLSPGLPITPMGNIHQTINIFVPCS